MTDTNETTDEQPSDATTNDDDHDHDDHSLEEWIVWTDSSPDFLTEMDVEVHETFEFGDQSAAVVTTTEEQHDQLHADDRVIDVEPEFAAHIRLFPDGISPLAGGLATVEDARHLHEIPADGAGDGITWVVMDTGIDDTHRVFANTTIDHVDVTGSGDGDDVGHGTGCASQIVQLAPGIDIISLRIFGGEGSTDGRTVMRAYEWLQNNTDRYDGVNMSWGTSSRSEQLDSVHNTLVEEGGVRDVVAAGNSGAEGGSPATANLAFSAGACTEQGEMASFSSYNADYDNPDVTAIGRDNRLAQASGTAMGTSLSGPWVKASGTSFAAPIVSAMVARYLSHTDAAPAAITETFEGTAVDIPDTEREGVGIAKQPAQSDDSDGSNGSDGSSGLPPGEAEATVWSPRGKQDWLHLDADWLDSGDYRAVRVDGDAGPADAAATIGLVPDESDDGE